MTMIIDCGFCGELITDDDSNSCDDCQEYFHTKCFDRHLEDGYHVE